MVLPAGCGGQPAPPPILSPTRAGRLGGLRNTLRAHPSQASISGRTPPCDLILAGAEGQEGICNAHFPYAKPREWEKSGSQGIRLKA